MGEPVNEPGCGDAGHPGADEGDALAGEEKLEVAMAEGSPGVGETWGGRSRLGALLTGFGHSSIIAGCSEGVCRRDSPWLRAGWKSRSAEPRRRRRRRRNRIGRAGVGASGCEVHSRLRMSWSEMDWAWATSARIPWNVPILSGSCSGTEIGWTGGAW